MLRAIIAVIVGWGIFVAATLAIFRLLGHDPHLPASKEVMFVTILWGVGFAFVGGWMAALIGGRYGRWCARIIAMIIAASSVITGIMIYGRQPLWSNIAALCLMAPAMWLGGEVRARQSQEAARGAHS